MQLPDTTPAPATVDDATRLRYLALSISAPCAGTTLREVVHGGPATASAQLSPTVAHAQLDKAERILDEARSSGTRAIVPGDEEWPSQIADLNRDGAMLRAPLVLWARGPARLNTLLKHAILITGSRASTEYGNHVAQQIAYQLADGRRGWTIANGGGFGIETEALKGAMVANCHTPQLVMLPCDLRRLFPHQCADMLQAVAATGLLLSPYPPGTRPTHTTIRHRTEMLACLTAATVIVETSQRSNCLPLARRAAGMGRPVLAVPGPVSSVHSTGCHQLIRDGVARLVTDGTDILAELGDAAPAA